MRDEAMIAALKRERAAHLKAGRTDHVALIDADLARCGIATEEPSEDPVESTEEPSEDPVESTEEPSEDESASEAVAADNGASLAEQPRGRRGRKRADT